MTIYGVLALIFFLAAGYYGAVRARSLAYSFEWVNFRTEEESKKVFVLEWRRKVRMMRFLMVALGIFSLVMFWLERWSYISLYVGSAAVFLLGAVLWLLSLTFWLKLGQFYPRTVDLTSFPVRFGEWLITPIHWIVEPFLSRQPIEWKTNAGSKEENESEEEESEDEVDEQMIRNALEFKDVRLRDCMIPRTEITGIDVDDPIEKLQEDFVKSGHSKIVVYRESVDNVIGYCHMLSMFKKPKEIAAITSPILMVPEAMPAGDLLMRFLEERKNLAVVVDEFGGTAGLVSIEDIIEQIFGEIQDEYDSTEDWVEREVGENQVLLSARHEIDYLNEKYNWKLPEGDYDTLGGLIIDLYEDIPEVGEVIELPPYTFRIEAAQDNRIDTILVTVHNL